MRKEPTLAWMIVSGQSRERPIVCPTQESDMAARSPPLFTQDTLEPNPGHGRN